jgi:hypothetical protein
VVGREQAYSFVRPRAGGSGTMIQAVDLLSGDERWQRPIDATPTGGPLRDGPSSTLAVVRGADGREGIAYTGLRVTASSGTVQDRREVVVGMLDAASGTSLWSAGADLPPGFEVSNSQVLLAGANEHHVISSVSDAGNLPMSLVVDVSARTAAWADKGFLAIGLDGAAVIGIQIDDEYSSVGVLRAIDAASRAPIWKSREKLPKFEAEVLAPGIVQIRQSAPFEPHSYLLNTKDGNRLADLPERYQCVFDQREILVCDGFDTLIGLELATLHELWRLPDTSANRLKPKLHAAYHGLVYADGQHSPVILDARTGRDAIADAAIAPDTVITGFGLVRQQHTLYA